MLFSRKVLLFLIGIPIIKQLAISPVFFYLQRKLAVDIIDVASQGKSPEHAIRKVVEKIGEDRSLLNYKILNLCRQITRDGLMEKDDLQEMEDGLEDENKMQRALFTVFGIIGDSQRWGESRGHKFEAQTSGTFQEIDSFVVPSLIPWEADTEFFTKHPTHKEEFEKISGIKSDLEWYLALAKKVF